MTLDLLQRIFESCTTEEEKEEFADGFWSIFSHGEMSWRRVSNDKRI